MQDVCNGVLNLEKCDNTDFGPISVQLLGLFPVNVRVTPVQGGSSSLPLLGGHGGRVVTLSPPTSEAGVRSPARPQVGKLVVACCWSAVYSTEP